MRESIKYIQDGEIHGDGRRWTNRYAKLLRNASSDKVQENLSLKVDALEQELAR